MEDMNERNRLAVLAEHARRRREELGLRQDELKARGGPSTTTLTKIENATPPTPAPGTLRKLDHGLGWSSGSARRVLDGGEPTLATGVPVESAVRPDGTAGHLHVGTAPVTVMNDAWAHAVENMQVALLEQHRLLPPGSPLRLELLDAATRAERLLGTPVVGNPADGGEGGAGPSTERTAALSAAIQEMAAVLRRATEVRLGGGRIPPEVTSYGIVDAVRAARDASGEQE
ncbi:helix-turn-helix domain-containing protein [Gordonia malaquae]|uniref:helix-turn-helix domain-containing protein n=1 Tax=Gordonia malaquae TaxID=410332 RepID=UPI003017FE9C